MSMDKKRSPNWTKTEIQTLVSMFVDQHDVVCGKFSASCRQQDKDEVFQSIVEAVGAVGYNRTKEEVKKKWRDLKSQTKNKERKRREVMKRTGGGPAPPQLEDWEEKIVSVLPSVSVEGLQMGVDCFEESERQLSNDAQTDKGGSGVDLLARTEEEIECHKTLEKFIAARIGSNSSCESADRGQDIDEEFVKKPKRIQANSRSCNCSAELLEVQKGLLAESKRRNELLGQLLLHLTSKQTQLFVVSEQS